MSRSSVARGAPSASVFATNVEVNEGDVIRVVTGNGGGCGDAKKRAPQDIARDLKNGYLTPERAKEIYGYEG